jgi:hypothetical protein
MKIKLRLDDARLLRGKQLAAQTGRTLTPVIEDALPRGVCATPPTANQKAGAPANISGNWDAAGRRSG